MDQQSDDQGDDPRDDRRRRARRRWPLTVGGGLGDQTAALRRVAGSRGARRLATALAVAVVALAGGALGVLLAGGSRADIGPFQAQLTLTAGLDGGTTVHVPPLGALHFDTHDGPARLTVRLGALDQQRIEALLEDPGSIEAAGEGVLTEVTSGVIRAGLRTTGAAVLGALLLTALVFRDVRRAAWAGGLALLVMAGGIGTAALTIRPAALEEPRYEGLLVNAPALVGDARRIADDYSRYAEQLQRLIGNVSQLYTTISTLPIYEPEPGTTRVLHVSDLHLNPAAWQLIQTVVEQFEINLVIDTGDITDWGSEPEASFVGSIGRLRVPYVFIRGNHDSANTAAAVDRQPNTIVLDDSVVELDGLRIAGIGDPRFTPDKSTSPAGGNLTKTTAEQVIGAGEQLARRVRAGEPVDICLVHDPASAGPLSGVCPLVLAGHTHDRDVRTLPEVPGRPPTLLMVQGSTGGAGLRGLEGENPTPLSMSVLYFRDQRLQAYDDITLGGTGQAQVNLERQVIEQPARPDPSLAPVTPTPTR